jgi:glycosyltransferase involved in cell wall biosynthesis
VRIVQLVETLNVGGLETMAVDLAIAHRNAGHDSTIYTVFEDGPLADRAREAGVPVVCFKKKRGFSADAIFRMARQLRTDRVEVLHTHNSGSHHYGVSAGRLAGVRAIVNTRHGLAFHSPKRQELYYRAVMPFTDAVVCVCADGLRRFVERKSFPENKARVIPNGIPVRRFQEFRANPGGLLPKIRFGTIGRLVKAKAHDVLVDAFALVARELPEAELHIWGYGELQPELLSRIFQQHLGGRIHYHGATDNSPLSLQQLDIFVLSSISEGLPLVILEAMAAGLPIVSSAVGGIPEVAPEGVVAWYCPAGDPVALAAAMKQGAGGDLAGRGAAAYRLAAERFSVEAMQQSYEDLFTEITGGRPLHRAVASIPACH